MKRSWYWMWSLASTSVSFTVFFFSEISRLSSLCCLVVSSLALRSFSVTCLILKFNYFSSSLRSSNSYCLRSSLAISFAKVSYLSSQSSSLSLSFHNMRSFLCFLISRWLPSTSGLSWSWRQSLRVDSFRSFATVYIIWRLNKLKI